jgi:hypothetical protein
MDAWLAQYTGGHLAMLAISVIDVVVLGVMAHRMYNFRRVPVVRARGVDFILLHTVISIAWVVLSTARGLHLSVQWRRWPLDLLQYGILQSAWVGVWIVRNVALEGALFGRSPTALHMVGLLSALLLFPMLGACVAIFTASGASERFADGVVVATSAVDVCIMHGGILQLRRLPAPIRISAEAEWCCVVALTCMLAVSLLMNSEFKYEGRYIFAPLTVAWVTFSWQYVQCKPVLRSTLSMQADALHDLADRTLGEYKSDDDATLAFLHFCEATHPATVRMVAVLSAQLTRLTSTDTPLGFNYADVAQDKRNRDTFFERLTPTGGRNSMFVGDEISVSTETRGRDAFHHRSFAYGALRSAAAGAYARECTAQKLMLNRIESPLYTHPALHGFGFTASHLRLDSRGAVTDIAANVDEVRICTVAGADDHSAVCVVPSP